MKKILTITIGLLLAMVTGAVGSTWTIDTDHSAANFTIKHMAISKVKGNFNNVSGSVVFHDSGPNPFSIDMTIDPASIDTGVNKRDDHLKSPDFFDINKYPSIHFVSKKVVPAGQGKYQVIGTLTMHGVTHNITVALEGLEGEVKDPWGNIRKGGQITGEVNRKDFGMEYNSVLETGNLLIGEIADVTLDFELIKQ